MRIGVVLLGLQLVVGDLLRLGWLTILAVIGVTAFAFAGTYVIGRIARLPGHEPLLFAAGFAICGASAIGAMAAVTRSDAREQSRPVALVTLCGTLAIVVLPLVAGAVGMSVHRVRTLDRRRRARRRAGRRHRAGVGIRGARRRHRREAAPGAAARPARRRHGPRAADAGERPGRRDGPDRPALRRRLRRRCRAAQPAAHTGARARRSRRCCRPCCSAWRCSGWGPASASARWRAPASARPLAGLSAWALIAVAALAVVHA